MEQSEYFSSLGAARAWAKRKIRERGCVKPKIHITSVSSTNDGKHNPHLLSSQTVYKVTITGD